jgi:hypothetical protein
LAISTKPRIRVKANISKASSEGASGSVRKTAMGYEGLRLISNQGQWAQVRESQIFDLQFPRSLDTFSLMAEDGTVSIALSVKITMILRAMKSMKIEAGDKEDKASLDAAKFLSWNLKNLDEQTFLSVLENICTYNTFGFSLLEKVYSKVKTGEFEGMWKVSKLAPRSQKSLNTAHPWNFSKDGRKLKSINQSRNNLPDQTSTPFGKDVDVVIPRKKLMIFSYGSTNGNPEGRSPCAGVYVPWKEKKIIEEYQVIGTTKDMGGTPLARAPIEHFNKAAADPTSPEAQSLKDMQRDLANLHSGEQAFMYLPSDVDEKGNYLYDIKLMGIEGGGKQFDLTSAISTRSKTILDNFGAGFMQLGNDGSGSYALMDGKTSVHEAFVERDLDFIISIFHQELFPQLLAMNDIRLSQEQMPVMEAGLISEESIDEVSKAIQRIFAVNAIPLTPEIVNENLRRLGYEFRLPEDMTQEELEKLLPQEDSGTKSGEGMKEGMSNGTGGKVGTEGGDTSTGNKENGGSD